MIGVALVIPTLNEEQHIGAVLDAFLNQEPQRVLEILVVDGGSTDETRGIVAKYTARDPRVRLVDNPDRLQASGVNRGVARADPRADFIIRVDAHAGYPPNFVRTLLDEIEQRDCDSVVVRLRTVGNTCFQVAVAIVCNSAIGTGAAAHRVGGGASRFVDHGHHAAFRRSAFVAIGGYDSTFAANEDAEFDVRLRSAGGRIWLSSDLVVDYLPRSGFYDLARQYLRYGVGRACNFRKHGGMRLRQFLPPSLFAVITVCLLLAVWDPLLMLMPLIYLLGVAMAAIWLCYKSSCSCALLGLGVIPTIHLCWAAGFWIGLLRKPNMLNEG